MSKITQVQLTAFTFDMPGLGLSRQGAAGVGNMIARANSKLASTRYAVRVLCDDGAEGAYVTHWVGTPSTFGQMQMLAPHLLGRDPEHRVEIFEELKREVRAYDHMGHGPLDIALWDLAGRKHQVSVSRLLGGFRRRLPVYASTYHGQEEKGGLDSPAAYADYARACQAAGFAGFKIHGWHTGDARREAANVLGVRAAVGSSWPLMLDPACQLRTYLDALYVGRACDEAGFLWYEDPYRDSGVTLHSHRMLRAQLKTPLLITEHLRGLEQKTAFLAGGGCDMFHIDPEYDMGITGVMKIVHVAQAFGVDVQVHACGPAHRAVISAVPNTHFYELALVGPAMPNVVPPVYRCGYSDQPEAVGRDGCVPVPDGPGLGVDYDWNFIRRHRVAYHVFK